MAQGSSSAGTSHRLLLVTAAFPLLVLLFAATVGAETSVYRCVSSNGNLEFRQTPCTSGAETQKPARHRHPQAQGGEKNPPGVRPTK